MRFFPFLFFFLAFAPANAAEVARGGSWTSAYRRFIGRVRAFFRRSRWVEWRRRCPVALPCGTVFSDVAASATVISSVLIGLRRRRSWRRPRPGVQFVDPAPCFFFQLTYLDGSPCCSSKIIKTHTHTQGDQQHSDNRLWIYLFAQHAMHRSLRCTEANRRRSRRKKKWFDSKETANDRNHVLA